MTDPVDPYLARARELSYTARTFTGAEAAAWGLAARAVPLTDLDAAVDALVAENGPPLVAHRAKELMHGLGRDLESLDRDTAVACLNHDERFDIPALQGALAAADKAMDASGLTRESVVAAAPATGSRARSMPTPPLP